MNPLKILRNAGGVFFLLIPLALSAFSSGLETNIGFGTNVPISTAAKDLPENLGLSDNGFYVSTALDIANGGTLNEESRFALRQWAPGTSTAMATLVKVFGQEHPLGVSWGVLNILIWTFVFSFLISLGQTNTKRAWLFFSCQIMIFSPLFKEWFFGGGYLYSESPSIAAATLALMLLMKKDKDESLSTARCVVAGGLLATAAYFKGSYEFVGLVLTAFLLIGSLAIVLSKKFIGKTSALPSSPRFPMKSLFYLVASFHLITIPWRIFSDWVLYPSRFTLEWTQVTSVYWGHRWMPTEWLNSQGAQWFADQGGNSACIASPIICKEVSQNELAVQGVFNGNGFYSQPEFMELTIMTFLRDPFGWLLGRFPFLYNAWFPMEQYYLATAFSILFALVTITALSIALFSLLWDKELWSLFFLAIFLGTLTPLVLQSIESRYLYPVQVASIIVFVVCVSRATTFHIDKTFKLIKQKLARLNDMRGVGSEHD